MTTDQQNIKEDARIVRTKRDLANALEELLQEKNFDELSVKDITDKALISKNTFYNNFKDKNELLNFLFSRYRAELLKDIIPYLEKNNVILRKIFFRVCLEKIVHAFYVSNLPLNKMIKADNSRSLYWSITTFIREAMAELDATYSHILTKKMKTKITAIFYSGAFASTLYFSVLEDVDITEEDMSKALLKLAAPIAE